MTTRSIKLDRQQFGPWAVVTGASSGIGRGFATQLAASGINVVLAARRPGPLEQVGGELASRYGVRYRAVQVDLSAPDFMAPLLDATDDLDVGLIVSNAGDAGLGEFLNAGHNTLLTELRLNAEVHLSLAHHFGQRLPVGGAAASCSCPACWPRRACRTSRTTPPQRRTRWCSASRCTTSSHRTAST